MEHDALTRPSLRSLAAATSPVFLLRLAVAVLSAATAIGMVRAMGPTAYGQYAFLLSWVSMGATLGALGLDRMLVKYVAVAFANGDWASLKGALRWSRWAVLLASAVCSGLLAWVWEAGLAKVVGPPGGVLAAAALLLTLGALMQVQRAALLGMRQTVGSQLDRVIQPVATLAALLILAVGFRHRLGVREGLAILIATTGLAYLYGALRLRRVLTAQARGIVPTFALRTWTLSLLVFLVVNGLDVLNGQVDTLMMGRQGAAAVGVYAILHQLSNLIPFGMAVTTLVGQPGFAQLHAKGDRQALQRLLTSCTRMGAGLSACLVAGLVVVSPWLLPYLRADAPPAVAGLGILVLGQLGNVAFGPLASLLMMTGHERVVPVALALGLAVNAGLCLLLVGPWGIPVAAVASTAGLLDGNGVMAGYFYKRLKVLPTIFPLGNAPRL